MSQSESTILGTSTISNRYRISVIKRVREEFERDLDVGDHIVFRQENGRIIIEPA